MPRVPVLEQRVQQRPVSNLGISNQATRDAFGTSREFDEASQANLNLSRQVYRLAQEEKKRADQIKVLDADEQSSKLETRLMLDPETGALNTRGENSFGVIDRVSKEYEDGIKQIEAGLTNDDQRFAFRRMTVPRRTSIDRRLQVHVARETQSYDSTVTENYIKSETDAAIASFDDPERVGAALSRQRAVYQDHAERNGLPKEWVEQKTLEGSSRVHSGIISKLLAHGQDLVAQKYYKNNKDTISGKDQVILERTLEEGSLRGESQRKTDAIIGKELNLEASLEAARNIRDPKLRDETVRRVKQRFADQRLQEDQIREEAFSEAYTIAEETKNKDTIPAERWALLSPSQKNAIENRIRQLRKGIEPDTDWSTYYNLKSMASIPATQNKFLTTNLMSLRHKMSDPEFKELINLQTGMRKGDAKALGDAKGYLSTKQIVDGALRELDVNPNAKPGSKDAELGNRFRELVDKEIINLNKKDLNNNEKRDIVKSLQVEVITNRGILWDTTKKVFELQPGEQFEIDIDQVPDIDKIKIREALQKRGLQVTDEEITRLYTLKLQGRLNANK